MKTINEIKEKCVSLFNEKQCYASEELINELLSKEITGNKFVNLAFTDYGGTFLEKCMIDYLIENYPNNIVHENTSWCGKNAIVYGTVVSELLESTSDYLSSLDNFEDYYYQKEYEAKVEEANKYIIENEISNEKQQTVYDFFDEQEVCTFGVDFSESRLLEKLRSTFKNDNHENF